MQTEFGGVQAVLDETRGLGRIPLDAYLTVTLPNGDAYKVRVEFCGAGDSDAFTWAERGPTVDGKETWKEYGTFNEEDNLDAETLENAMLSIEAVLDAADGWEDHGSAHLPGCRNSASASTLGCRCGEGA